ncbi:MAG TPA: hypothetical protein VMY35_14610 [Phycisphaerae bacterium]|nr:hypothetical protein [Phycisphaerae bacterium]
MAIVKLGGTVVGIRGTVGGVTYSANKSGPYAKAWGRGSNPRSPRQQVLRGELARLGRAWQALDQEQRDLWDAFAALSPEPTYNSLGEEIELSGWGYYCRINVRRLETEFSLMEEPPEGDEATPPPPLEPTGLTLWVPPEGPCEVEWDELTGEAGAAAIAYMAMRPSSGQRAPAAGYYLMGYDSSDVGTVVFTERAISVFGSYRAGWTGYCKLVQRWYTGLQSAPATIFAVVE